MINKTMVERLHSIIRWYAKMKDRCKTTNERLHGIHKGKYARTVNTEQR